MTGLAVIVLLFFSLNGYFQQREIKLGKGLCLIFDLSNLKGTSTLIISMFFSDRAL